MKNITLIFVIIFILFSCSKGNKNINNEKVKSEIPKILTKNINSELLNQNSITKEPKIDTLNVSFEDFIVQLIKIEYYEEETEKYSDSINIVIDFTQTLDNTLINIKSVKSEINSIEVFENYKTSLSIMNEGPHFDLYEWKGYVSDWKKLNQINASLYKTDSITGNESIQFPKFTKNELIKYLKDNNEEYWIKIIENPYNGNWRNTYWIGVGLRRLKFNINYKSGKEQTKYLNIYIPMGC